MQIEKIARRYAKALLLLVTDDETLKKIEINLNDMALLFKESNPDFLELVLNPVFVNKERREVVRKVSDLLKFEPATLQFLELLVDKERLEILPFIAVVFSLELDTKLLRARTTITSARKLAKEEVKNIVTALQNRLGQKIEAKTEVDPKVLGGVRAKIGGFVFDRTVEAQLDSLKQSLISSAI